MAENVTVSEKFSLQLVDILKGIGLAIVTAIFPIIQESLKAGDFTFDWKTISIVALGAFVAYIGKNFFAAPSVKTTYTSNDAAKKVGKDIAKSNEIS